MADLLQTYFLGVGVSSLMSVYNPKTRFHRCDYQHMIAKHRCLNCKGKPFNLQRDLEAVSESKRMTQLRKKDEICRRYVMLCGVLGPASFLFAPDSWADLGINEKVEEPNYGLEVDEINAYSFSYPLKLPKQKIKFNWVESRKPERYSSAAPLSADARQRIVSERLDVKDNLVISVSIGPPNYRFLTSKDKNTWEAKDVAESVLSDKSTSRLTTGQRVAETSLIDAHGDKIAGEPYWYYEYLAQKSPTTIEQGPNIYRHSLAVTYEREGYLYSLNASGLSTNWKMMEPVLRKTISSFRLLPPTQNYIPPYKDPWRFW